MELKNKSEDNLGIFIGSNDVKGVTDTVTTNGVKKLTLYNKEIEKNDINEFSDDTIKELNKAVELLKMAEVYAQRIDWLVSGDDGEDSFHNRLKFELEKL